MNDLKEKVNDGIALQQALIDTAELFFSEQGVRLDSVSFEWIDLQGYGARSSAVYSCKVKTTYTK